MFFSKKINCNFLKILFSFPTVVRSSTFKIIDSIHSSFVSVEKQERHPETTESAKHHNVLGGAAQLQKGITPISGLAKPRRLAPIEKKWEGSCELAA